MCALRSLLTNIICFSGCILLTVVFLPVAWIYPKLSFWVLDNCSRLILWTLKHVSGLSYNVIGKEHIPSTPALFVSQHQSMWEVAALRLHVPAPCYVVKKSLLSIPVFGFYFRKTGLIGIDRSNKSILKTLMTQVKKRIDAGHSLIIFPEGTRVEPGTVGKINPSFTLLAQDANVPIVPVTHDSGLYWPRRSFHKHPGTITLEFHPPLSSDGDKREIIQKVTSIFEGTHKKSL